MQVEYYGEIIEEVQSAVEAHIEAEMAGVEFHVMTEDARFDKVREEIRESLWAFNIEFILSHAHDGIEDNTRTREAFKKMQQTLCESSNPIIACIIKDLNAFIEDAVETDGYGHFLSRYDGEETEFDFGGETFFIYRQG